MEKRFDTVVIGAGMSGLAAGIRLAHFGQKVCVVEKHSLWGGLNSFYKQAGRPFDVGLHAMTNYAPRGKRGPLSMICRQLRIDYDELRLKPQKGSEVRFPAARLRFSNDRALLEAEVARAFPSQVDSFRRLVHAVESYDDGSLAPCLDSAKGRMALFLNDPLLLDMLICPLFFYGSATEEDMDWHQFVIMFKAVYLEGFCRPEGGVRRLLDILKREYVSRGGELRLKAGVRQILPLGIRVRIELESGETWLADRVISSAGKTETARLLGHSPSPADMGQLTFVETIFCLDESAPSLGWDSSILFFSHRNDFHYRKSPGLVDTSSGIVCCPENFDDQSSFPEGILRVTSLANFERWQDLKRQGGDSYARAKEEFTLAQIDALASVGPTFADHVVYRDSFTPMTIQKFSSHDRAAVYGAPQKVFSGETGYPNVFLCGTDQGYLGIVGSLLSGVIMANRHALAH